MEDPKTDTRSLICGPTRSMPGIDQGRTSPLRIPERIGSYRIIRILGQGGMGVVYEAEQDRPHRRVALKVILRGCALDEHNVRQFQREVQALALLKHPGIANIYDAGRTAEGEDYFAMELVAGVPFSSFIENQFSGLPANHADLRFRLSIFRKICSAIAYAHQRGVIHRDLKPSNIMIIEDAGDSGITDESLQAEIKILDFGLARIINESEATATRLTESGQLKGTLPYMSPEQFRGISEEIDVRSDVYALGVILYQLLTGRLPYDILRVSITEAVRVICEDSPMPMGKTMAAGRTASKARSGRIDRDLETIVRHALEKSPARRYQSAAALSEDVERYLTDQPIIARPPSTAYQLGKMIVRHKTAFASALTIVLLLVGFSIVTLIQSRRIARERDKAVTAERLQSQERDKAIAAGKAEQEQRLKAESSLVRANSAEKKAVNEAESAKQVTNFLVDLFKNSDPDESKGETIMAREILDKGASRIKSELRAQPLIQAKMLDVMGNIYLNLGLYKQSVPLLEEALSVL